MTADHNPHRERLLCGGSVERMLNIINIGTRAYRERNEVREQAIRLDIKRKEDA